MPFLKACEIANLTYWISMSFKNFLFLVFLMTCFLVNLDLYYILTNPFYPVKKRTFRFWKYILLSSLLYTIIINVLIYNGFHETSTKIIMKTSVRILLAFLLLIISILIFKRLRREGMSNKLIRRVLNNWVGLIIISIMSLLVIPFGLSEHVFKDLYNVKKED